MDTSVLSSALWIYLFLYFNRERGGLIPILKHLFKVNLIYKLTYGLVENSIKFQKDVTE